MCGIRASSEDGEWLEATGAVYHSDPTLLVESSVTAVVQVNGKVRERLEVGPKIEPAELEKLALSSAAVIRAIGDAEVVNVIVKAPRLVSIAIRQ